MLNEGALARLEATAQHQAGRAAERTRAQRALEQRGILQLDEPQRVSARLNVD